MASNELEVLDPAAPVEKLANVPAGRAVNRRNLMAGLGIAGAAIGAGLMSRRSARRPSVVEAASFANSFSQVDYLNFLLNIKYLQTTLYSYVVNGTDIPANVAINGTTYFPIAGTGTITNPPGQTATAVLTSGVTTSYTVAASKINFTGANGAQINDMIAEIYYDELNQLVNLQTLIGPVQSVAVSRPNLNLGAYVLPAIGPPVPPALVGNTVLFVLKMLEDLSVTAYAGAAEFLSGSNLAAAAQIMAADGFHAGALRLAIILQNAASPGVIPNFVAQSNIDPETGAFYVVQPDDVSPVDPGTPTGTTGSVNGPVPSAPPTLVNITFTGSTTSGSASITSVSSIAGLGPGFRVAGAAIPVGATIVSASGTTVTISANATATASGSGNVITCNTLQQANCTTPTAPITVNGALYAGCTAPQYQGFFDTTGSGSASNNAPPVAGLAFKRTTSQVLSILYGTVTGPAAPALPSTAVPPLSAVISTGGFFPLGVNGQITII